MKNKVIALALAFTTLAWVAPITTQAATTEELQAQITALLAQISALQAQLSGSTTATTSSCFTKTLQVGSTGTEVTALQNALKGDATIYPEGLTTGYFGSLTEAAVKKFQAKYGIDQVGIVGPVTRAKLNSLYCSTTPTPTPSGSVIPTPVAGGLSVTLASDTPAATSVIDDSTGAQALAPFAKFAFTAGSGAVQVTTVKLLRSGISTNSDVSNIYLYEGDTRIAEMSSIGSDNVVTFTNSAGLFTVAAGSTKYITVKADITNAGSSGKTMRFGINAASDVVSNATGVTGAFPMNGNYMTWASVTDLGEYDIAHSTYPTALDPSASVERELWRMTSSATNQKIELRYMKFTMIGTASYGDFSDLKLTVGSTVYGPVQMSSDKTVTFDLGSNPYVYEAGQTKNIILSGKVIGGANRNFYFALQNAADVVAYDKNYNAYLKPNQSDTWSVVKAAAATTINAGSLTIARASDSPSGNVAVGATNVELAKFTFTAAGESVKVMSLPAHITTTVATTTIKNVKLLVDGTQIGSTDSSVVGDGAEDIGWGTSFGSQFIVNAGETKTITIKGDLTQTAAHPAAESTVLISLEAGTDNYQKMSSGAYGSTTSSDGYSLTLKAGTIVVAKNVSVSSGTSSNPTGVAGQTDVRIGSFTVTAGSGEAVDVTQLVIKDVVGDFPSYYTNLRLKDSAGNVIGSTYGTLTATAATTYSFIPTSAIRISAGQQAVFNIYADVKSSVSAGAMATATVDAIYATGVSTSQTADDTTSDPTLQSTYAASKGVLTLSVDSGTPISQQVVAGKTYEFARYKLAANASEDITVTDFTVSDDADAAASIADLTEFKLYDVTNGGKTLIAGPVYSLVSSNATADGYATFTGFNFTVPKSSNKIVSIEAKVAPWYSGQSANTHTLKVYQDYLSTSGTSTPVTAKGANSGSYLSQTDSTIVIGSVSLNAQQMTTYRTKVSATVASDSPSGSTVPSATHQIFKFTIANESNDGSYAATLNGVAVTLNATNLSEGTNAATATRTFSLYKDSITSANKVAEIVLKSNVATTSDSTYGGTLNFGTTTDADCITSGWTNYVEDSTSDNSTLVSTGVEIPAGGSKTFILVADTTTPKTTATATAYINPTIKASVSSVYGLTWTDGDATGITTVDTLPLDSSSKTLSW